MYFLRFKNPVPSCSKDEYCRYPWIELYPVDNAVGFPNIYPKESHLSGGQRYPIFKQFELFGGCLLRQLMAFFSG